MKRLMCLLMLLVPVVGICEDVNNDKETFKSVSLEYICEKKLNQDELDIPYLFYMPNKSSLSKLDLSIKLSEVKESTELKMSLTVDQGKISEEKDYIDVKKGKNKHTIDLFSEIHAAGFMAEYKHEIYFSFDVPNTDFKKVDIDSVEPPTNVVLTLENPTGKVIIGYTCNRKNES